MNLNAILRSSWLFPLGLGVALFAFAKVSFVLAGAYHEGGVFTMGPVTDAQRIAAASSKVTRALPSPAQFGDLFVSRAAGSPAVCGTVSPRSGIRESQGHRFVVINGDMFFNQDTATTHDMWVVACTDKRL